VCGFNHVYKDWVVVHLTIIVPLLHFCNSMLKNKLTKIRPISVSITNESWIFF
jgi:hypothetical protein